MSAGATFTGAFDVVGAQSALATFGSMSPRRLGHGYLFTGVAGIGKKTFARRFAQSLLCDTPKATVLGYCDACPSCTLVRAGTHPDLIARVGTIKIGDDSGSALHDEDVTARDLVRELALHAYRSSHRVAILGDVAFATHEAANALLKFFEEPPAGVVALLTTSTPGSLLATIRSRFVEVPFAPLRTRDVEAVLVADGVDPGDAHAAALASLGSVVRARAVLGDDDGKREAAFAWIADTVRGKVPDASFLDLDDRGVTGAEKREAVGELIAFARAVVRDWLALTLARGDDVPMLVGDRAAATARFPERDARALGTVLAELGAVDRIAQTNVSAGLVVEALRIALTPRS